MNGEMRGGQNLVATQPLTPTLTPTRTQNRSGTGEKHGRFWPILVFRDLRTTMYIGRPQLRIIIYTRYQEKTAQIDANIRILGSRITAQANGGISSESYTYNRIGSQGRNIIISQGRKNIPGRYDI